VATREASSRDDPSFALKMWRSVSTPSSERQELATPRLQNEGNLKANCVAELGQNEGSLKAELRHLALDF
jgi:hypothetical protein